VAGDYTSADRPRQGQTEDSVKITKHKTNTPGEWRLHVNGSATGLIICKGDAPKYRAQQMYDLLLESPETDYPDFLFEAPGVGHIISRLERIGAELAR
jgi:hypothetical protein